MAIETEIKLRISQSTLALLQQSKLLKPLEDYQWRKLELENTYFDSPDFDLANAKVALRIRKDGDQLIQTLKTKGASVAGLSERNEWDWFIEQPQLDLALLDGDCWPQQLQQMDKTNLSGIFTTNFRRLALELKLANSQPECVIEIALDSGLVKTADASEEICELELELRSGEPQQLLQLALQLAQEYPLMPCDISKAERGYRLLLPNSFDLQVQPAQLHADTNMDTAVEQLVGQLLSASQRLAEQYRHSGNWKLLERWIESLIDLRALLSSAGQIIPRKSSSSLRGLLDELLEDWLPVYQTRSEQQVREQAVTQFAQELENTRWGRLSLELALWLQQRSWTSQRNVKAQRQATAILPRWLQRFLAEELDKLPLQEPQLLEQQQARIERIQFWLEHGRHLLEQQQLDELFGTMRKLYQALLAQSAEQFSLYATQLWQNSAFKQLIKD